jgi:hypothetical protein
MRGILAVAAVGRVEVYNRRPGQPVLPGTGEAARGWAITFLATAMSAPPTGTWRFGTVAADRRRQRAAGRRASWQAFRTDVLPQVPVVAEVWSATRIGDLPPRARHDASPLRCRAGLPDGGLMLVQDLRRVVGDLG